MIINIFKRSKIKDFLKRIIRINFVTNILYLWATNKPQPTMSYFTQINELTARVPTSIADFSIPRDPARTPTQASSNFITNKEQGDWAENLVMRAINETSIHFCAVKYGKSDNLVAGEEGFDDFYKSFQEELDTIGKRPDLLIFRKIDFDEGLGTDISHQDHGAIQAYVRKAIAGIEVRSSAFLIDRYDAAMHERTIRYTEVALQTKERIITEYMDVLNHIARRKYIPVLQSINPETLSITDFKVPGWSANDRLIELNDQFKQLKKAIQEIQKRDFLSITPKVEDLKVVLKWIEMFNVPHYYFQVFFDKVYGISFENILQIITDPDKDGVIFSVEKDTKNQNKTTIKIKSQAGKLIANRVEEPEHRSVRKEMDRGRLLFYVTFQGGTAYLDVDNLREILGINQEPF
jgi:type II restriction enzyme